MKSLNEMQNQNGSEPSEGAAIEPLDDFNERVRYVSCRTFPAVWQGRGLCVPFGTPGTCQYSARRKGFVFIGGGGMIACENRENVFVPEWGRSLADMLAREKTPVELAHAFAEAYDRQFPHASDSEPVTNHQSPITNREQPSTNLPIAGCICSDCRRAAYPTPPPVDTFPPSC